MKANELRIGNWVSNYKDTPTQILEWTGNEAYLTEGRKAYGIKTSSPIPLTEEWLIKFGATQDQFDLEAFCLSSLTFDYYIIKNTMLDGSIYWMIDELRGDTCIQYVHQFQNLYFALTGEELEIK